MPLYLLRNFLFSVESPRRWKSLAAEILKNCRERHWRSTEECSWTVTQVFSCDRRGWLLTDIVCCVPRSCCFCSQLWGLLLYMAGPCHTSSTPYIYTRHQSVELAWLMHKCQLHVGKLMFPGVFLKANGMLKPMVKCSGLVPFKWAFERYSRQFFGSSSEFQVLLLIQQRLDNEPYLFLLLLLNLLTFSFCFRE